MLAHEAERDRGWAITPTFPPPNNHGGPREKIIKRLLPKVAANILRVTFLASILMYVMIQL